MKFVSLQRSTRLSIATALLAIHLGSATTPQEEFRRALQANETTAPSSEWSAGSGAISTGTCNNEKIPFDPYLHKANYTIGVHAVLGLDEAFSDNVEALGHYLTVTAGQRFDPPISFNVVPYYFDGLFTAMENNEIDFVFANPGIYACIGTQVGATALATVIKHLEVRGQTFNLDVYGGVIAVRRDNDEINVLADLAGKIIGAGAIVDLMGGQMQIYQMMLGGMSYVNDPKQVVFTKNQDLVIRGVLSGRFDVGFVRTGQIETSVDDEGNPIDPDNFKIIAPKVYLLESGELFPFLHSTEVFPEWPFASLSTVPEDVQEAVQIALLNFGLHVDVGDAIQNCLASNSADYCNALSPSDLLENAPCDASQDLAKLAKEASLISKISGWRPSLSYFVVRTMQQEAGFLTKDGKNNWQCTRPKNLYEGITCPDGYFKRHLREFENSCNHANLPCDDNEDYDCFCQPCVEAFEVDVYYHAEGEEDPHLEEYYGADLPGCEKMEICGTIEQKEALTLRIFDNMERDDANVTVVIHAGSEERTVQPKLFTDSPYAREFTVSDSRTQVQVIEVLVNGEPISQSPIRVVVEDKDCAAQYGASSNLVANADGECVCAGNTYEMGGTCLESQYFFLIIFAAVFIFMGVIIFFYLGYKKKQSDSVWHVSVEELHFNEPPEVIGQGGFGVVILGQYRGTKVAVKRVLPPIKVRKGGSKSLDSDEDAGVTSAEIKSTSNAKSSNNSKNLTVAKTTKKHTHNNTDKDKKEKTVKFGDSNSSDIESQSFSKNMDKRGSVTGSSRDWERLMNMGHSDNDILKILESATSSDHGSGDVFASASRSTSQVLMRCLPLWLRFDEHSRRVNEFVVEMRMLSRLRHPCITTVMGAVISPTVDPMLVMEFMEYGSLYDLLHNETMTPGGEIILQVIRDIVQGIQFLHASKPPILHGDLKAKNILVDSRFRAKVADFGFSHFKTGKQRNVLQGTPFYMAPEYLRRRSEYTTACDIYSLAMIFYEIYARASPFEGEDPRKILPKVCHPRLNKRPPIPETCPPKMVELMKKCWSANAFFRPSAKDIDYVLVEMSSKDTEPLETAKECLRDNLKRKPTSLYDVFPKHIADALNAGKKVEAESHEIVTIVFSDIVGFTTISEKFPPMKVSNMLDRLYQAFDALADKHHIFKVETIGDAYMGVTNLDGSEYDTHVKQIAEYAIDAVRAASQILIDEDDPSVGYVQIRVGFNSGPVVSNVIGSLNPRYGLFGDTVNTASRMESNSMPGRIHCSLASAKLLETQAPNIPLTLRGIIKVKGKGKMKTYWVGGDDIASTAPNPYLAEQMEPLSEREEDDPTNTEHTEKDFNDHSHTEHTERDAEDDVIAKSLEERTSQSDNSQGTHKTHEISLGDSTADDKDHFIKVHCSLESPVHQRQIQMDGSVKKLETVSDDGMSLPSQLYSC